MYKVERLSDPEGKFFPFGTFEILEQAESFIKRE